MLGLKKLVSNVFLLFVNCKLEFYDLPLASSNVKKCKNISFFSKNHQMS